MYQTLQKVNIMLQQNIGKKRNTNNNNNTNIDDAVDLTMGSYDGA